MNCAILNEFNDYVMTKIFEKALTLTILMVVLMLVLFRTEKQINTPILPNNIHDECISGSSPIRNRFSKRSPSQGELVVVA